MPKGPYLFSRPTFDSSLLSAIIKSENANKKETRISDSYLKQPLLKNSESKMIPTSSKSNHLKATETTVSLTTVIQTNENDFLVAKKSNGQYQKLNSCDSTSNLNLNNNSLRFSQADIYI